ncbi:MAG: hypothetical protein GY756_08115 [bacterium]|nr:hypothetical protein [bacterium]
MCIESSPSKEVQGDVYHYQYHLTDHLGNTRVTFDTDGNVLQEDSYYPFGMTMNGLSFTAQSLDPENKNKFLYNGKELQDDHGLDWHDYGARMYDAQIGRFFTQDPLTQYSSGYVYVGNNPISMIDPTGMWGHEFGGGGLSPLEQDRMNNSKDNFGGVVQLASRGREYIADDRQGNESSGGGQRESTPPDVIDVDTESGRIYITKADGDDVLRIDGEVYTTAPNGTIGEHLRSQGHFLWTREGAGHSITDLGVSIFYGEIAITYLLKGVQALWAYRAARLANKARTVSYGTRVGFQFKNVKLYKDLERGFTHVVGHGGENWTATQMNTILNRLGVKGNVKLWVCHSANYVQELANLRGVTVTAAEGTIYATPRGVIFQSGKKWVTKMPK